MDSRFSVRKISNPMSPMQNVPENKELRINLNPNPNGYLNAGFVSDNGSARSDLSVPEGDRKKSFVHHTREALPRVDNYRNDIAALKRPSIGELHGEERDLKVSDRSKAKI